MAELAPEVLEPKVRSIHDIKFKLMQPALTSHFECYFTIPSGTASEFISQSVPVNPQLTDLMTISCSEASLPGSSLVTHDLNNDYTGVTQKHAYRRQYDNVADFTFYVNTEYTQIRLFEAWIRYISGEQIAGSKVLESFYRVKYPKYYKTTIYITKFERNIGKPGKQTVNSISPSGGGRRMVYSFFNAFPSSITSMPISYDTSQLLKCTVSFIYDRYVAGNDALIPSSSDPSQSTGNFNPTGNPGLTPEQIAASYNTNLNHNIAPSQFNRNFVPDSTNPGFGIPAAQSSGTHGFVSEKGNYFPVG